MNNDRYGDFLSFYLKRLLESAELYSSEAKLCKDQAKKLFLLYLASRKREQYIKLEKDNEMTRGAARQSGEKNLFVFKEIRYDYTALNKMDALEVRFTLCERAQRDFKLFIQLASLEEESAVKRLLIKFSKLSKVSINDVTMGFALFITPIKKYLMSPVPHGGLLSIATKNEEMGIFS
ncbi:MAG: hypothetical protein FWE57_03160 [Chitinispirillia bacterium]|nr:hypothetical protein [Chitinispirillia bacterium]